MICDECAAEADSLRDVECRNCGHVYYPNENIFQHDCRNPAIGGERPLRGHEACRGCDCMHKPKGAWRGGAVQQDHT